MLVQVDDQKVAEIVGVRFPAWAKLSNSSLKTYSAALKAVDLDDAVRIDAREIELASAKLKGIKVGKAAIKLLVIKMDDDEGNPIPPL